MLPHNLVNEFEHYLFFIIFDDLKKYVYIYVSNILLVLLKFQKLRISIIFKI